MTDQPRSTLDLATVAMLEAMGENPRAFHTRADYASGYALADHAIPLWRNSHYRNIVRAVLLAIREPDETLHPEPFDERYFDMCRRDDIRGIWQAMIDSILGEGK